MTLRKRRKAPPEPVAGNGLLDRRALLGRGIVFAGATTTGVGTLLTGAAAEPLKDDQWSLEMGSVVPAYQVPSRFEKDVIRTRSNPNNEFRNSHARTPHHLLQGTVTPNGLFFSISHSGLPDIDPAQHKLVIHGLVKQPLVYTADSLSRYPMVTRMHFLECSGNSAPMFSNEPVQATAQALHGLCSNAEWTGVLLSTLLEETGIDPRAKWLLAEGADSLALHRSVPVKKALDDAISRLYGTSQYERIDYHVVEDNGRTGVVVSVREKAVGGLRSRWGTEPSTDKGDDLPPNYVPGAVRVDTFVTVVSSGRRSAAESARGHDAANSAGVRYPSAL